MTESPDTWEDATLYHEPGAGWQALVWAPAFALAGYLTELLTGGPRHTVTWMFVAAGLCAITAPWVYARRRFLSVRLTRDWLWQGQQKLALSRISSVTDVGSPVGAPVLGGGWTVPRKYDELPIRLDDGTVVLAWARDGEALCSMLSRVVDARDAKS